MDEVNLLVLLIFAEFCIRPLSGHDDMTGWINAFPISSCKRKPDIHMFGVQQSLAQTVQSLQCAQSQKSMPKMALDNPARSSSKDIEVS